MKKKLMIALLVLALTTSMIAGCGGSGGQTTAAPTTAGPTTAAPTTAGIEVKTELVIAINADIATMHPTDHSTTHEMDITNQIYDPLMKIALDGKSEPQPRIAKSYEISEDGLRYTFHLRDDVTFHDGTKLTAEDVKFSAELYSQSTFQGSKVTGMVAAEVIDEYTVVLVTETPYAPFLQNVMDMHICSKNYYESVTAEEFATKPIGAGPYKFSSRELGSQIVLESYEGYYMEAAQIKNVTFKIIPDDTTVAVALQTGEVDFAAISPANHGNLVGQAGLVIQEVPSSRFGFISMNHEKEPFSQVKFRQAVSYGIDRENIVNLALDGFGEVNSNILSPLRFGYSENQPKYAYDPEKAKALLTEIGIQTPYDLGIMYVADPYKNHAQIIQNDLKKIGLELTIEILEFNAFIGKLMNGDCGMTVLEMTLEGDTQQFQLAFKSEFVGRANNVRYSNADMDALFNQALTTIDADERFDVYQEIFTKAQEEAIYVTMYNRIGLYAYNKDLTCHEFGLEGRYYLYEFSW